ncbi:hypothetical protein [Phytoactinopolyspora halotolerans]|uniref:DUF222 domain-containing protein n=1 Tax=Phytoactinopolyspora halotolerans TaxID=1981512 RepID=A0A6L9S7W9_9ACTN|nr:hypothetical protein [Phytoactinopolyspora halotolerans]NEE01209.1 hypothetical protein [Phytoactinopolyspora halotolerans]
MRGCTSMPCCTCPDVRTDDGLREALDEIVSGGGWDGRLGRHLLDALGEASHRWALRRSDVVDADLATHLVGVAWEFIATHLEMVKGARSPWRLIHVRMRQHASTEVRAEELCTSARHARKLGESAVRARHAASLRTAARVSPEQMAFFDAEVRDRSVMDPVSEQVLQLSEPAGMADWDEALRSVHAALVAAGAPPLETAEAISAVVDSVSKAESRSRTHTTVYRSPQLEWLSPAQRRALAALLIGTRRGGPPSSTWLELHRSHLRDRAGVWSKEAFARVTAFVEPFGSATQRPWYATALTDDQAGTGLDDPGRPGRRRGVDSRMAPPTAAPGHADIRSSRCGWRARQRGSLQMTG